MNLFQLIRNGYLQYAACTLHTAAAPDRNTRLTSAYLSPFRVATNKQI